MVLWTLGIGISIAALVVTAALKPQSLHMAYLHMAAAAVVTIGIALTARRELRQDRERQQRPELLASTGLRYLGLVWAWGGLALLTTYGFVLQWREWWHFVIACAVLAAVCLVVAAALTKDADAGRDDATMLTLARILTRVHLAAMVITVIGLIVDGKMVRFLVPRHQDWAAQNIFFFGAVAMAAISWIALVSLKARR
jgi:hypothetical protein